MEHQKGMNQTSVLSSVTLYVGRGVKLFPQVYNKEMTEPKNSSPGLNPPVPHCLRIMSLSLRSENLAHRLTQCRHNTKSPNEHKTDTKSNVLALLLNAVLLSELTVNILSDAPSTSSACFKKRSKSICNETLNITMK